MMKRLFSILLLTLLYAVNACPQNYTLRGQVEEVVHVGERFRLSYTVNSTDAEDFRLGQMPSAIDVLYGPAQSTSISSVYANGHSTTNRTLTLTYTLSANSEGQYTIPPASISIGGQTIRSKALTVNVVASGSRAAEQSQAGQRTSAEYFFVLANPTKRRVVQYEPLLLTYKVCWHTDLPVRNLDDISLELQNVYMQPYNDTQQKSQKVEQIGGRTLCTVDWKQFVIYPQKAGTLHIPSVAFTGYVRQNVPIDPYDPFTTTYREIPQELHTPELNIQVDSLPERPDGFSGGVGRLNMSGQLDKTTLKANTPLKLTVTVSGQGNLNMLSQPDANFPSQFDTYDTRQTEDYEITANGISGDISYEFMAVPQREGRYVIPPVKLIYFDLDAHAYRTLQTDSFQVTVTPGDPGSSSMNDFTDGSARQRDIHPIKTGPSHTGYSGHSFFASSVYWIIIGSLVALAAIVFLVLHYRSLGKGDVEKNRAGKARRVATRRLRKAERLMRAASAQPFYDETLRALWGYVGDRLNMPVSSLTRDNVSQQLQARGVSEQPIALFVKALDECEFMRYAPGDPQGNMNQVYDISANAIEQIEKEMKSSKKKHNGVSAVPIVVLITLSSISAHAVTKEQGDEAYSQGNYDESIEVYSQLVSEAPDASVYYNMGNAYYRLNDMAHAVLCYERALMLQPGDDDTRYNLQLAYSKTVDNIAPEREMFFITWYHALSSMFSANTWAIIAIVMLALALLAAMFYWFAQGIALRKVCFFCSVLTFAFFILSNIFAWKQQTIQEERHGAIVMQQQVSVSSTPGQGTSAAFTIHAGTKVSVNDDTMAGWLQITLPDGRQGWIPSDAVEII